MNLDEIDKNILGILHNSKTPAGLQVIDRKMFHLMENNLRYTGTLQERLQKFIKLELVEYIYLNGYILTKKGMEIINEKM